MAKNNAYAVWVGRVPGVYDTWAECEAQVKGYPGAKYKGYTCREFAEQALTHPHEEIIKPKEKAPVLDQGQGLEPVMTLDGELESISKGCGIIEDFDDGDAPF